MYIPTMSYKQLLEEFTIEIKARLRKDHSRSGRGVSKYLYVETLTSSASSLMSTTTSSQQLCANTPEAGITRPSRWRLTFGANSASARLCVMASSTSLSTCPLEAVVMNRVMPERTLQAGEGEGRLIPRSLCDSPQPMWRLTLVSSHCAHKLICAQVVSRQDPPDTLIYFRLESCMHM
jgi:hypothetical protein